MKNAARVVLLGLMLTPVAFVAGCGAKKCGGQQHEPVVHHKLEKMKKEYGGK